MHSLILVSLQQIKPSMSAQECQGCSDWAVSSNLMGIISCAWCRHETAAVMTAAEDATVLPLLTQCDASGADSSATRILRCTCTEKQLATEILI